MIEPDTIGVAETTRFTITAEKMANEDLSCRFFQNLDGVDVRISSETDNYVFSKESESIETTLKKNKNVSGSQTVKILAFCLSKDEKARYTKSIDVFLKPKPESTVIETTEFISNDAESELLNIIDPVGLLIFAGDMNDEQRVSLFTDMTEKLFVKSQM
jgi:hypothetical protein